MAKKWRIAGINWDHMHMGDLLRMASEAPNAEIVGIWHHKPEQMQPTMKTRPSFVAPVVGRPVAETIVGPWSIDGERVATRWGATYTATHATTRKRGLLEVYDVAPMPVILHEAGGAFTNLAGVGGALERAVVQQIAGYDGDAISPAP